MAAAPLPISAAEIDGAADRLALCPDDRVILHRVIEALDAVWMERQRQRAEAERHARGK